MTLFAALPTPAAGQIVLAVVLAVVGVFVLLPKPKGRSIAAGIAALIGAAAVFGAWLHESFGKPMPDVVGTVLFYLFSAGALGFGTVLVVQRNPARGAIAFAFVILSTCGLFLLLAAPFLMAATVIIYAGAIIVTFLFVLMLSHNDGASDENDRSREPLLGSLAGFAFTGLILFTLYQAHLPTANAEAPALPAAALTPEEKTTLTAVADRLAKIDAKLNSEQKPTNTELTNELTDAELDLENVVGVSALKQEGTAKDGSLLTRLRVRVNESKGQSDPQAASVMKRAASVRESANKTFRALETNAPLASDKNKAASSEAIQSLRNDVRLLAGVGELPARNVGNIGYVLYSDHLLAVELAGTLLLVATIGAVAIAHRKGAQG